MKMATRKNKKTHFQILLWEFRVFIYFRYGRWLLGQARRYLQSDLRKSLSNVLHKIDQFQFMLTQLEQFNVELALIIVDLLNRKKTICAINIILKTMAGISQN